MENESKGSSRGVTGNEGTMTLDGLVLLGCRDVRCLDFGDARWGTSICGLGVQLVRCQSPLCEAVERTTVARGAAWPRRRGVKSLGTRAWRLWLDGPASFVNALSFSRKPSVLEHAADTLRHQSRLAGLNWEPHTTTSAGVPPPPH